MILYIDMDNTIADFDARIKFHNPLIETKAGPDWEKRSQQVNDIVECNRDLFFHLKPIPGSREAIEELKHHFEIYFLSTPMWAIPESFADKRRWIDKHYGMWAHKRLILTHRKDLNIGDFLIDDNTHNGAGEFTGEHIHFGTERFPNWPSITNYLLAKILI